MRETTGRPPYFLAQEPMTTKPPSPVKSSSQTGIEKIAYTSVAGIPTVEPHDLDRLGYNVWRWLTYRRDSLEHAVRSAGSRLLIGDDDAIRRIRESLKKQGVDV
jgi:hypothetical protein